MKNFIFSVVLSVGFVFSTLAQSTINVAVPITWAFGTNATTTTASGLTGIAAFGTNIVPGTVPGATTLASMGGLITSMTIANNSAGPVDLALFDAPRTPLLALYTNNVYTTTNATTTGTTFWVHPANGAGYGLATWTQALVNVTKIVTNFTGVTTTNTFTNALASGWWTNNCSTNNFRRMWFMTLPANTTVTPNLGIGIYFGHGITITNGRSPTFDNAASNITVSLNFDPAL